MKKAKLGLVVLLILFIAITAASILTLTLNAKYGDGEWAEVCCGEGCPGGTDYCVGNGTYTCCK